MLIAVIAAAITSIIVILLIAAIAGKKEQNEIDNKLNKEKSLNQILRKEVSYLLDQNLH